MGEVKAAKFGEGTEKKRFREVVEDAYESGKQKISDLKRKGSAWLEEKGQQMTEFVDKTKGQVADSINSVTWKATLKENENVEYEAVRTLEKSMKSVNEFAATIESIKASIDKIQSQSGGMHNESVKNLRDLVTKFDSWTQEVAVQRENVSQVLAEHRDIATARSTERGRSVQSSSLNQHKTQGEQLKHVARVLNQQKDLERRAVMVAERIVKEFEIMEDKDITNSTVTKMAATSQKALTTLKNAFVKTSRASGKMDALFDRHKESVKRTTARAEKKADRLGEIYETTKDGLVSIHKEGGEKVKATAERLDEKREEYEEALQGGSVGEKLVTGVSYLGARAWNKVSEGAHKETKVILQKRLERVSTKSAKAQDEQQQGQEVLAVFEK